MRTFSDIFEQCCGKSILWLCLAVVLLPVRDAASQQALDPAPTTWLVKADFAKNDDARTNLSGAACVPTTPPFGSCLIVNDEKKYAQFFSIEQSTIIPGAVIRLSDADGEIDAEAAAYDDGLFYVVGSHGRSRHKNKENASSYVVMRFPVDRTSGKPLSPPSDGNTDGVQQSPRLRDAIKAADHIRPFYDKPLADNGANIEGIAVKDGRMYLGFRGPSVDDKAFILAVDAKAVFTKEDSLNAVVHALALGPTTGIRDLAAVRDGLLVLAGPVNEQSVPRALFHWNENGNVLTRLRALPLPASIAPDAKAETVLVLQMTPTSHCGCSSCLTARRTADRRNTSFRVRSGGGQGR